MSRDVAIIGVTIVALVVAGAVRSERRPRALLGLLALGVTSLGAILVLTR